MRRLFPSMGFAFRVGTGLAILTWLANSVCAQIISQPATTVQLPTFGVSIDAEGVLTTPLFAEAGDPLFRQRLAAAQAKLPGDVFAKSLLRKISLRKLNAAIQERLDNNQPLDETMQNLAGLLRIKYVFILPDEKDIIIVGQAEGWMKDASGRTVGVSTGKPTILLDDLVVALRNFAPDRPNNVWVGCTIGPDAAAVDRLSEFNKSVPRSIPQHARAEATVAMVDGMREALGLANIGVFSISAKTHMAHVMIEADYRMKMIAVGLEAPPVKMHTFVNQLKSPPNNAFQRWWFTPDYKAVRMTPDKLSIEIMGDAVQLLTEDYGAGANGQLMKTGREPSGPAKKYSVAFTKKYAEIAELSPVFQQLRNMVDLLVIGAFMQQQKAFAAIELEDNVYYDDEAQIVSLLPEPRKTPCVANAGWNGNRLIAVAGGGVSIQANQAFELENLVADPKEELSKARSEFELRDDVDSWWYD